MFGEQCLVGHLAGMGAQRLTHIAWQDMDMEMIDRLSGRRLVELLDKNAVRAEGLLDGARDDLDGFIERLEGGGIGIEEIARGCARYSVRLATR